MTIPQLFLFALSFFLISIQHSLQQADTKLPITFHVGAYEGDTIILNCSFISSPQVKSYWLTPISNIIKIPNPDSNFRAPPGQRVYAIPQGSLVVKDTSADDIGLYTCFQDASPGSSSANIKEELVKVPYLITKANYAKSFGIALGAALGFLLLVGSLWAINRFRHKDVEEHSSKGVEDRNAVNEWRAGHNEVDTPIKAGPSGFGRHHQVAPVPTVTQYSSPQLYPVDTPLDSSMLSHRSGTTESTF